jgi:hypothetical protein
VITDIWESGGLIHYRAKNVGDAPTTPAGMPTKSFCNCLSIDGKQVAKHCITQLLQPGQEVEGVFDYAWQPTPGEHAVKVCADCEQNIEESNEGNNCLEEKWLKEKLPDLVIVQIKFDEDRSLVGYVLKNVGMEIAKGGHSTTLYVDGRETAHDTVSVDLSPGGTYESWFKDYKVPGSISIRVKVCADNYNQVKESDEKNNCLERILDITPPTVTITHSPANVTWLDKVTFSAAATDDTEVTRIVIYLNGSKVKECAPPLRSLTDGKYYCFHVDGPFQAGVLNVTAEAFDPAGNRGVCEEDINVTIYIYPPPITRPPRLCWISGKIYNFPYNPDTLKIKVCEAEQVCAYRINPVTMERELVCGCQCKMVKPETLGAGWTYSWVEYADVRVTGEFQPLEYNITVPCSGTYLLQPVYHPCPYPTLPECECIWRGTWSASKGFCVRMDGTSQEGYDFAFNPLDTTIPSVTIEFSNDHPRMGEEVEIRVSVRDAVDIDHILLQITKICADGSRMFGGWIRFDPGRFTEHYYDSAERVYKAIASWRFSETDAYKIIVESRACDMGGNLGSASKTLEFGCPEIRFEFENGGRLMRSDFPIFGLPDEDEDGINDCWENAAMEAVNPYIELDENEDLHSYRGDHVVNFVRVTPYPDKENPRYILFFFVVTWSHDYGRSYLGIQMQAHDGDTEPFVMAWRIIEEDKRSARTLNLEYVYIEAHGGCNKHRDLWTAYGISCNEEPYCDAIAFLRGSEEEKGRLELCSTLQFKDNRLYLYASEDKHGLYPSCEACETVIIASADVGAVDYVKCVMATFDFIGCFLWAGASSIMRAIGEFIYKAITAPFNDEYLGTNSTFYSLPNLLGEYDTNYFTGILHFRGDTGSPCSPTCPDCHYHYWIGYGVYVDAREDHGYSRDRPHVRISLYVLHCEDSTCDWGDSDEVYLIVAGFSMHRGGINVWRVGEFFFSEMRGGSNADLRPYVVFDGEIDSSYVIGFYASLSENDNGNPDLDKLGEEFRSEIEEELRSKVQIGECDGNSYILLFGEGEIDENCAGGEVRLFPVYNVGELEKLVLNNLDGSERALGGKELATQDRFPGESIEGKLCPKGSRVFCGGTGSSSCECATAIYEMMYPWVIPEKLARALEGGG